MKLSKKEAQEILNMPTIGALCLTNWGGIAIKDVNDEVIKGVWYDEYPFKVPVQVGEYWDEPDYYFYYKGTRFSLDEFMRV